MTSISRSAIIALTLAGVALPSAAALAQAANEIPRAASTPTTPKNWRAPAHRMKVQAIVDRLIASHPEVMSITVHALPKGQAPEAWTMIAGSFADRIGNTSSPGDVITAKKGVTQVESKWGTPDYGKKVSVVLPVKDSAGKYLPVAMVIAFHQSPSTGKIDTDFMAPGIAIRDGIAKDIATEAALYEPVA